MPNRHVPQLEIESLAEWDEVVAERTDLNGWIVQSVDLTDRENNLDRVEVRGAFFLGCALPDGMSADLEERGALVFPELPDLPFDPYRARLYQSSDLYDAVIAGQQYADSMDATIYGWLRSLPHPISGDQTLAMSLHDHAISNALSEAMAGIPHSRTVGLMGGHAVERGSDDYIGAARLASQLTVDGSTVVTGGGPGAMEAGNLGAHLAGRPAVLTAALHHLAAYPTFKDSETMWVATALEVRQGNPASGVSFGVPTWHYGHEPANVFATEIAKYFSNALREDTLLRICGGGIVYLPGSAGTLQELFQSTVSNFYAADPSLVSPTVLVDEEYWTETLPAWPLIKQLARGRHMDEKLFLVSDVDEAAELLKSFQQ